MQRTDKNVPKMPLFKNAVPLYQIGLNVLKLIQMYSLAYLYLFSPVGSCGTEWGEYEMK